MSTHVHTATKKDIAEIVDLHVRSWRENYRAHVSAAFLDNDDGVKSNRTEVWNKRLGEPNENQYVGIAKVGGQFAGFVCICLDRIEGKTLVDNLHVEPHYRKQHVGTHLMYSAAQWIITKRPHTPVYLEAYSTNTRAQDFYQSIGGRRTTDKPFLVKAVDGGQTKTFHIVWNTPYSLFRGARKK